ncbi:MAG: hypothetical protein ACXAEN_17145 [Candidatus Thorarchaeota archaeon]
MGWEERHPYDACCEGKEDICAEPTKQTDELMLYAFRTPRARTRGYDRMGSQREDEESTRRDEDVPKTDQVARIREPRRDGSTRKAYSDPETDLWIESAELDLTADVFHHIDRDLHRGQGMYSDLIGDGEPYVLLCAPGGTLPCRANGAVLDQYIWSESRSTRERFRKQRTRGQGVDETTRCALSRRKRTSRAPRVQLVYGSPEETTKYRFGQRVDIIASRGRKGAYQDVTLSERVPHPNGTQTKARVEKVRRAQGRIQSLDDEEVPIL